MGALAVGVGKVEEALQLFKTALEVKPDNAQFYELYYALINLDRMAEEKLCLNKLGTKVQKGIASIN